MSISIYTQLEKAYRHWCEFYGHKTDGMYPNRAFREFLEDDLNRVSPLVISRTTRTRLDMLLSPHWYALLKVYDAKRASNMRRE